MLFSPDSKKMVILGFGRYQNQEHDTFHSIDLESGADTFLYNIPHDAATEYSLIAWRSDGNILFSTMAQRSYGISHFYSLTDGTFHKISDPYEGKIASDGMRQLVESSISSRYPYYIYDSEAHEGYIGDFIDSFDIIEPISHKKLATIGEAGQSVSPTFSPDGQQVLFSVTHLLPATAKDFSDTPLYKSDTHLYKEVGDSKYYLLSLTDYSKSEVSNGKEILANWRKEEEKEKELFAGYVNIADKEILVSSENPLRVLATYWQ